MILNLNKMFCSYNCCKRRWDNVMMAPSWLDIGTAYCCHPTGVVLAGAAKHKIARNVAILFFNTKECTPLPLLPVPLQGPGILCRDKTLYVFGGSESMNAADAWTPSRRVYSLYIGPSSFSQWKTLQPLKFSVEWPIALSVAEYICVVGGVLKSNCAKNSKTKGKGTKYRQMYDTCRATWHFFDDVPACCDTRAAGGFVQNGNVIVYTSNQRLTLDLSKSKTLWSTHDYKHHHRVGSQLTPVLFNNKMYACIVKDKSKNIKTYNSQTMQWQVEKINVEPCKHVYYFFVV